MDATACNRVRTELHHGVWNLTAPKWHQALEETAHTPRDNQYLISISYQFVILCSFHPQTGAVNAADAIELIDNLLA